jgi:hypothetical protein
MLLAWPRCAPRVRLRDAESARIDDELSGWIAAVHRDILGTREFVERRPQRPTPLATS